MTCEEIDGLLAAHAVAALPPDEAGQVRAHLATCRRHDDTLAELGMVTEHLPLAAPDIEPPAGLRARMLEAFDAEVAAQQREPVPMRPAAARRRWFAAPQPSFAWAAAAVLLLAVIGLGAWNAVLQLDDDEQATITTDLTGSAGRVELVYLKSQGVAVFNTQLAEPPVGREYQAWGIEAQGPVSLGLLPSNGTAALRADLSGASAVAISVEPEGGSEQPTTDPVLLAQLN